MKTTGIILAGGKNKRIGTEKAFIQLKPELSLIENTLNLFRKIFSEIIIVSNNPLPYLKFETRVVEDLFKDKGPLSGIFSGLCFSNSELNFVIACDMPFPSTELIKYIIRQPEDYDLVIPEMGGRLEPLFARYSKSSIPAIFFHLVEENLKLQDIPENLQVLKINLKEIEQFDPQHLSFFNVNTEEDLEKAKRLFSFLNKINN